MTQQQLPFSPLTHHELNRRVGELDSRIASHVICNVDAKGVAGISPYSVDRVTEYARDWRAYQSAAEARCDWAVK